MNIESRRISLSEHAQWLFNAGDYQHALEDFCLLSDIYSIQPYAAFMEICRKKLDNNYFFKDAEKISVIIPCYNAGRTIRRALNSILEQSLTQVEIIVYDDASTDNTLEVVREYMDGHENIKLIVGVENCGQGFGRNMALERACGEYVTFLDADDYYQDKNFLASAYASAIKNSCDMLITPYCRQKREGMIRDKISTGRFSGHEAAQKFLAREFGTHAPGGKLIKRQIAVNCQFREVGYSEDVLYVFSALLKCSRVLALDLYGYVYDNTGESSYNPTRLNHRHFFSSLCLLQDLAYLVAILAYYGLNFNLDRFMQIWTREHGARISQIFDENYYHDEYLNISLAFKRGRGMMLALLPSTFNTDFLCPAISQKNYEIPVEYKKYINFQDANFQSFLDRIDSSKERQREHVIIYCQHLSDGGLEKMAAEYGNVLSRKYDVYYVLDEPGKIAYAHHGTVLPSNLLDASLLALLKTCKFIFDFRFKYVGEDKPFCAYGVDNYKYKYIPTIHNSDTCKSYFDVLLRYAPDNTKEKYYSIICVSNMVKKYFQARYNNRGVTNINSLALPNPISLPDTQSVSAHKPGYKYILFVGRLNATKHKGLDILIPAFLKASLPDNIKLVLAGPGNLDKNLQDMINNSGKSASIVKPGFCSNIYEYMAGAMFVCAPSRWEGCQVGLLESLACGTPVLTTEVGIAPEAIEHERNGILVKKGDIQDTQRGIEYMANNYMKMKPCCRESVKDFDRGIFAERLFQMLENANEIQSKNLSLN